MKTTIEKEFVLPEGIEMVWAYLSDPTRIVGCVPGASLTEKGDEKNYKGQVTTSFGPVKASYNGAIEIVELNQETYTMVLQGKGIDSKGKGRAEMTMKGVLLPAGNETSVKFVMDISVVGMLAQFGSRLIKDVSDQLLNQFMGNFKDLLAGKTVDNKMSAASMVGTVLKSKIGGIFDRDKAKGDDVPQA